MSNYHFVTRWEVEATPEEVYRLLEDVEKLVEWWPSVYLDIKVVDRGQSGGVGKKVLLYTKGWLPYTLKWSFMVTEVEFPKGYSLEAYGDFSGKGVWTFRQIPDSSKCEVIYDWNIIAEKPLLKKLSFLFRPIFSANHHWAMNKGLTSLKLEMKRRKAPTEAAKRIVPPPPGPTFPHNFTNNKVF